MSTFTRQQMECHLDSLRKAVIVTVPRVKQRCMPILKRLLADARGAVFHQPVDASSEPGLEDYHTIVRRPMDLGTMKKRLETGGYRTYARFIADLHLTFDNAILYNEDSSLINQLAREYKAQTVVAHDMLMQRMNDDMKELNSRTSGCTLCCCSRLLYEPMVYYCNGRLCSGKKIRRNVFMYSGGNNQYHWCVDCYNDLDPDHPLLMVEITLMKRDLIKKKNDERRREAGSEAPSVKALGAVDLPHTKCSEFLETQVRKRLIQEYERLAAERGIPVEQVEQAPPIYIRQVSNVDRTHQVRPEIYNMYKASGYPLAFPCRSKCLVLFQNLDGVDTILFGMYVYEYGHKCPLPNQRRVYISYLDSVRFFRPDCYRTLVYHEILESYLRYVKQRGFHTAHIWACPPCKGDDYILYCHPEDQKTPKDDRLVKWYVSMLEYAKEKGSVLKVSNLYEEYFSNAENMATVLPYLEGVYWVGEAENIIKEMRESSGTTDDPGTRLELGSTAQARQPGKQEEGTNKQAMLDPVMAKLAQSLQPMENSFIVAKLHTPEFVENMAKRLRKEHAVSATGAHGNGEGAWKAQPDETEDPDEMIECEFFDTRQAFLNLCQGNHYQFDQLRRAKHTSVMVLYHLHNPDAPRLLTSCRKCGREIAFGVRYHCDVCTFDVCSDCFKEDGGQHVHKLHPVPVIHGTDPSHQTAKQRDARERSVQVHMALLQHASTCSVVDCNSENCDKMKGILKHHLVCQVGTQGGCHICRRIWVLLQLHARQCTHTGCKVPRCLELKEKLRRIMLQQQAYDDRRREATNERWREQT
ncbi:unnamed protein product [Discosporangium mesarthrocarpum]